MLLLLLLLAVVVVIAAAGLFGIGVLSADSRRERTGVLAALSAPVVLVAGVVVLALFVVGGLGVDGPRGGDAPGEDQPQPQAGLPGPNAGAGPPTSRPSTALPSARVENVPSDLPIVLVRALDEDEGFALYLPVGGLTPGGAVRVLAQGFGEFERGRAEQCVVELGRQTACSRSFPVQFDEFGAADFLFVLRGDISVGGCRVAQATCLLRVSGDGGRQGATQTVLADQIVAGQVTVTPARGIVEGQPVDVAVTGFPAGAAAVAVVCAPPAAYDARRCSEPLATVVAGRASVVIPTGRFGADGVRCGPRDPCAVVVVVGPGFVAAAPAVLTFSRGPGVEYDGGRILTGVAVAAVLMLLALFIGLRTDWTKPSEAATPDMDGADLRAADSLDELFGTDAELDERDPIPW